MNHQLFIDLIHRLNKKKFLNQWINNDYQKNPLLIYGNHGLFKSSLAEYILKDHSIIKIDIEFCKSNQKFENFINLSLNKCSIKMMLKNNKYKIKALIIDDINYILKCDKNLFNSILKWIQKLKIYKYPIILIIDDINYPKIRNLLKIPKLLKIQLLKKDYLYFTNHYFLKNKSLNENQILKLLKKSNYNFNSLVVNLNYLNNDDNNENHLNDLNNFLIEDNNILILLKKLLIHKNYNEIFNLCYINYDILSLSLIDNLNNFTKNIKIIDKIYSDYIIYDNFNIYKNYHSNEYYLIFILLNPIYLLQINNHNIQLNYNKYISKSIIYINNRKFINYNSIMILFNYLENNVNEINLQTSLNIIIKDNNEYEFYNKKILNKFLIIYQYFKKDTKITKKLINKNF